MKSLILMTTFAMLIILAFMIGWSMMVFSYANRNLLSSNYEFSDKVFLAQLYRSQ